MIVLLALVAGDKLTYLKFLNANFFAALIIVGGSIGFAIKLVRWKISSRSRRKSN
jgi:hypothetical protein